MTTILHDIGRWLETPVTPTRLPCWLDPTDRQILAESIVELLTTTSTFPGLREAFDAVLTELGVAEARNHMWPERVQIARRAHGMDADVLPIRMSREERNAVLGLPQLPTTLRTKINGATEKK